MHLRFLVELPDLYHESCDTSTSSSRAVTRSNSTKLASNANLSPNQGTNMSTNADIMVTLNALHADFLKTSKA